MLCISADTTGYVGESVCQLEVTAQSHCWLNLLLFLIWDANISLSIGPLWSRLKYLNNYWMDCCEIWCRYSWSSEDVSHWLWWASDFSSSATMRLTFPFLNEISHWMHFWEVWYTDYLSSKTEHAVFNISSMTSSGNLQSSCASLYNLIHISCSLAVHFSYCWWPADLD